MTGSSLGGAARIVARAARDGKAALLSVLLAFLLSLAAPAAAMETIELTLHTRQGPLTYFVEIARTRDERSRGLMFRQELPKDHGMLFDFGTEQPVTFWMENTPLSLDMLFIDGTGAIVGIKERAVPLSQDTIPSLKPVRFVLEILGGSAAERGIRVGDRLGKPLFKDE